MFFEVSKRKNKNGRRNFKIILHEIYPDECIDIVKGQGTISNINGITWIRKYCEQNIDTIEGMSLRVEFLDDERTEICGHGETGMVDGLPLFNNATVIGFFKKGYVDTFLDENGTERVGMFGEGEIDEMCYHDFVKKLKQSIENGDAPYGSVEIFKADDNESIEYLFGYKEEGRIPMNFRYSGYALLGVAPADKQSKIVELNKSVKEEYDMTEEQIKQVVSQYASELNNADERIAEINSQCEEKIAEAQADCQSKIDEANANCKKEIEEAQAKCEEEVSACKKELDEAKEKCEQLESEKNEIISKSEQIQEALDKVREEQQETHKKLDALWEERNALEKALGEARAKERLGELNSAISGFTQEEIDYAKDEIEAFKANPIESEINSVVDKIYACVGKNAKAKELEEAQRISEINAQKAPTVVDIFTEIQEPTVTNGEVSIY